MNGFYIIRYVPMWILYLLARIVSLVMIWRSNTDMLKVTKLNLLLAYPEWTESQRQAVAIESIKNQTKCAVESAKCWAMPPQWSIDQIHTVHNQQVLMEGLSNPKGMLAIVPHLGTWEMMNAWLNQFGSPTIMYKPVKGKKSNEFVLAGRQRLNATLVPTDATGVKAIFKTLKAGGFSIILPDHVPEPSGGEIVPFFGIPTLSSTLASKLASKTQCKLVGLTCVRRDDGKGFDIYCEKLDDPNLYSKDMIVATTAINQALEKMITRFPSQYMWNYKRFRRVPNFPVIYHADPQTIARIHQYYPKTLNRAIIPTSK